MHSLGAGTAPWGRESTTVLKCKNSYPTSRDALDSGKASNLLIKKTGLMTTGKALRQKQLYYQKKRFAIFLIVTGKALLLYRATGTATCCITYTTGLLLRIQYYLSQKLCGGRDTRPLHNRGSFTAYPSITGTIPTHLQPLCFGAGVRGRGESF
jgi:hypothetical protein